PVLGFKIEIVIEIEIEDSGSAGLDFDFDDDFGPKPVNPEHRPQGKLPSPVEPSFCPVVSPLRKGSRRMPVRNLLPSPGTRLAAPLLLSAAPAKSTAAAPAAHAKAPAVALARNLQLFALGQSAARPVVAVPGIGASDLGVDGDFHPLLTGFPGSVSRNPFAGP